MPTNTNTTIGLLLNGVISLALIAAAFLLHSSDRSLAATIFGAIIAYWLRESIHLGQQVGQQQVAEATAAAVAAAVSNGDAAGAARH